MVNSLGINLSSTLIILNLLSFQIGSIMLIHIPDSNLQEKCHIISHILVTNKGQAHDLQVRNVGISRKY